MGRSKDAAVAIVCAAALIALAALVAVGALTGVDRFAAEHLMPWLQPSHPRLVHLRTVFLPETRQTLGGTLVALWTYPASPFVSGVVVAACAWVLERRGRRREAAVVCAVWLAANVVELAGKLALGRPPVGVSAFRHSFPSGHTARSWVVVAALAWTGRRAALPAALWALGVAAALVALGDHTPSDVAGGFLLAAALVATGRTLAAR